jgi:hypothetical protein
MHTTRDNYKAKWLAAVGNGSGGLVAESRNTERIVDTVINAEITTHMELTKLQAVTYEAAHVAKELAELMTETRLCAGIDYGESDHMIDSRLGNMPLHVVMRRIRDVLKMAKFRVGMLSVACDELNTTGEVLINQIQTIKAQSTHLQRAAVNTLLVGPNSTEEEYAEFGEARRSRGRYDRYNIRYDDLSDDVFENFNMHADHRTRVRTAAETEDSSDDSDDENRSRGLVVSEQSKRNHHSRDDSAISDVSNLL